MILRSGAGMRDAQCVRACRQAGMHNGERKKERTKGLTERGRGSGCGLSCGRLRRGPMGGVRWGAHCGYRGVARVAEMWALAGMQVVSQLGD